MQTIMRYGNVKKLKNEALFAMARGDKGRAKAMAAAVLRERGLAA
jgi:hypothetical protein